MTPADFLRARIAEDEQAANDFWDDIDRGVDVVHIVRWDPARVLAECDAKRRILERVSVPDPHTASESCIDCDVLYLLALPYADHPDYRDEWRLDPVRP